MLEGLRTWAALKMFPGAVNADATAFASSILGGFGSTTYPKPNAVQLLEAYNHMPWLRAVIHKISHSSAMVPWKLYRVVKANSGKGVRISKFKSGDWHIRKRMFRTVKETSKDFELEEVMDHPVLDLLSNGHELFPGFTSSMIVQMHLDLVGEACQLKERSKIHMGDNGLGRVKKLLPIPPTWIKSLPTTSQPSYEIQFAGIGDTEAVAASDVIFYRDPNPKDPFGRGSGVAGALGDELQGNEAASQTIRSRLENNSIPPFVAMPKENSGEPPEQKQIERIQQSWDAKLRGPAKGKGMVHFLRAAFDIQKLGNSFEELMLIPLLNNQRDTVLQVYGAPPELFGIIENSNRATIDAAETLFARHVIMPRMEHRRATLQIQLVDEIDDTLILDYESPVPDDKEYELSVMKASPWPFKANEIREKAGRESLGDDGEVFNVPSTGFIQTSLKEDQGEPPEPDDTSPDENDSTQLSQIGDDTSAEGEGAAKASGNDKARKISRAAKSKALTKYVLPSFKNATKKSGQRRLDELNIDLNFDMTDPHVLEIFRQEAGSQIVGINATTRKRLRRSLSLGYESGESIGQLAARVRNVFSAANGRRSVVIARTESIRAMNAGQVEATRQAGFPGKQWLSTRDEQVRDTHAPGSGMDGQIVAIDKNFESPSGASGPFPGSMGSAEEDIQCRCTTISIAKMPKDASSVVWGKNLNTEEKREKVWRAAERIRVPIERQLRRAIARAFAVQEKAVLEALYQLEGTDS